MRKSKRNRRDSTRVVTVILHIPHDPETSRRLWEACRAQCKAYNETVAYLHDHPGTPVETNRRIGKITLHDLWARQREETLGLKEISQQVWRGGVTRAHTACQAWERANSIHARQLLRALGKNERIPRQSARAKHQHPLRRLRPRGPQELRKPSAHADANAGENVRQAGTGTERAGVSRPRRTATRAEAPRSPAQRQPTPGKGQSTAMTRRIVNGGEKPRINGEQRVAEATTCRVERQGVASRQAALRLLRCAPALRVTRRNPLTQLAFMAGSRLPAVNGPLVREHGDPESQPPYLVFATFRRFWVAINTHRRRQTGPARAHRRRPRHRHTDGATRGSITTGEHRGNGAARLGYFLRRPIYFVI